VRRWRFSPILNLGSRLRADRETEQPWCERYLFRPLRERGVELLHVDAREGEGIDIRADLMNPRDVLRLKA